ncbi:tRNA 5-methoxyuridine(34)/uridine 5-oxyacetic acid(34) synthase CmoB [Geomonas nitrogeniifigens]|uniref:tRNA 5-methoxyuridine(34)/uridine 5-oxyacetic acid(34) synthase CmoB n=1 Tax=Geomonas diazotrophica TaxID=2843197 RepID=A0ABX8JIG9_9BACT|nr:tRNA 5-methoxyuridine(34)/uridine 5-oxyacetic acid(34) synthase CmoB [Geomonas nitrogeniifigens]QWV97424.1 tRNA 5-methoxyuridine(34)/uridine 5-oxyacetic acid(34) synthase CmoB [Geomonas nitrogeniifigens]QXE86582.1 tRNA 5-methoxyuridine(34)/uridine 5-oxyacetic acid(34) synthase CmoB [Geomonas nitrogeniifigens]
MNFYDSLYPQLVDMGHERWAEQLQATLPERLLLESHGKLSGWQSALQSLPDILPSRIELQDSVTIGSDADLGEISREDVITQLRAFHPWRKGPYNFFGIGIDTEWRSDWKWERVVPHIAPLAGRRVLDVGCGNGYHGWRMRGAGADFVLGIEPFLLSVQQFQVMQRYLRDPRHHVIPIGIEDVPPNLACFDSVFSMGVLYHRRSPLDHLFELKGCLRPGGELILETLIVEGDEATVFMPQGRYAKMRNVWFLPSIAVMTLWLQRCGFTQIACVDTNRTSREEQRSTEWMQFESLADFLDPDDAEKTIEGHPAPLRAIFTAKRP